MSKEEKFNELDTEIKDQKAFRRKSKFVLKDRDILEMIEPACRNFEIAHRIEQVVKSYRPKSICLDVLQANDSFEENQCRIVMLDDILINAAIDNDEYQIDGHIDEQSIVHVTISKVAHNHASGSYVRQLSNDVQLNIAGDFGIYLECTIDVHESQLEQSIIEALDKLRRKYTVRF
jgi:hypothetical protein